MLKIGRPFRMQRGINYALEDRIENLIINKGHIFSTVIGTAPTPYRINIHFQVIPDDKWKIIIEEIAKSPLNLIKLLEGTLPEEIIEIFEVYENSLFPDVIKGGLNATCSCPDKAIPCKHIAATILYIARVLDYNPFILITLRGKTKSELLRELHLESELPKEENLLRAPEIDKYESLIKGFNVPKIGLEELLAMNEKREEEENLYFNIKKPPKVISTLENLGNPPNLENPTAFNTVFKSIYQFVTNRVYKMAMDIEEK